MSLLLQNRVFDRLPKGAMITSVKLDLLQILANTLVDSVRQTAARWTERLRKMASRDSAIGEGICKIS